MRLLRVLNSLALLLIFAPFFQMCNDDPGKDPMGIGGRRSALPDITADTIAQSPVSGEPVAEAGEEQTIFEEAWESITFPGRDITGFGLLVSTVFSLAEGNFDFGMLAILNSLSIVLTVLTLIKLFRRSIGRITVYYVCNLVVLTGAFIAAYVESDYDSPVKWGFYAYFFVLLATTLIVYRSASMSPHPR